MDISSDTGSLTASQIKRHIINDYGKASSTDVTAQVKTFREKKMLVDNITNEYGSIKIWLVKQQV